MATIYMVSNLMVDNASTVASTCLLWKQTEYATFLYHQKSFNLPEIEFCMVKWMVSLAKDKAILIETILQVLN